MYEYHVIMDLEMNPVERTNKDAFFKLRQEVIEIGAVKLDKDLNIIDRFDIYVKPEYNRQIEPDITKLTGIHSGMTKNADTFEKALAKFAEWVGCEKKTRIYSWSDSDPVQLRKECAYKGVQYPTSFKRWLDFQRVFPRMMQFPYTQSHIALTEAVKYFNIYIDNKKVHGALYDAEITTALLIDFLNGSYKKTAEYIKELTQPKSIGNTIAELCGGEFADFYNSLE